MIELHGWLTWKVNKCSPVLRRLAGGTNAVPFSDFVRRLVNRSNVDQTREEGGRSEGIDDASTPTNAQERDGRMVKKNKKKEVR